METVAIENRTNQLKIVPFQPVAAFDFSVPLIKALEYHAKQGERANRAKFTVVMVAVVGHSLHFSMIFFRRRANLDLCVDRVVEGP